jgi:hypothetical protein
MLVSISGICIVKSSIVVGGGLSVPRISQISGLRCSGRQIVVSGKMSDMWTESCESS